jgi:hypothetical protein
VASVGRIGLHHQPTQIVVTFNGVVNPTLAENPDNYSVITSTGERIRIKSATYNPATNAVTLIPAMRLNVHLHFRLSVMLPCPPGMPTSTVIVPFGGKMSLIGFHNHLGEFVVVHDAEVVGYYNHLGEFVPFHKSLIALAKHAAHPDAGAHPIHRNPPVFRRPGLLRLSGRGKQLDAIPRSGYGSPR